MKKNSKQRRAREREIAIDKEVFNVLKTMFKRLLYGEKLCGIYLETYTWVSVYIAKRILVGSESGGVTKNYHFVCFFSLYVCCAAAGCGICICIYEYFPFYRMVLCAWLFAMLVVQQLHEVYKIICIQYIFVIASAAAAADAVVVVAAAAVVVAVFNDSAANAVIAFVARFAICFVFIHWLRSIFSIFIACKLMLHRPYKTHTIHSE